jgi:hypothetical protein
LTLVPAFSKSKHAASNRHVSGEKAKASQKPKSTPATKPQMPTEAQREAPVTKLERLLTLLSQPEGASIEGHCQRAGVAHKIDLRLGPALG